MPRLTIEEAQNFYRAHHAELVSDYKSVVRLFRDERIRKPLSNSNYLHALSLTALMMEETSFKFRMLTGGAVDGFLDTLTENFRGMLDRIRKNVPISNECFARILIVNGKKSASLDAFCNEFSGVLDVAICRTSKDSARQFTHFIVSDADMVRDEKFHEPLSLESDASEVLADVHFYDPTRASLLSNRFDTFWKAVRS